jgi:hypothetical protein
MRLVVLSKLVALHKLHKMKFSRCLISETDPPNVSGPTRNDSELHLHLSSRRGNSLDGEIDERRS